MNIRFLYLFFLISTLPNTKTYSDEQSDMAILRAYIMKLADRQEGFSANTKVKQKSSSTNISELQADDFIISKDLKSEQKIISSQPATIAYSYEIELESESITAAPNKLFFDTELNQWVPAKNITFSSILSGQEVLSVKKLFKPITVYKLTTETRELILEQDNLLVHNHPALIAAVEAGMIQVGHFVLRHPVAISRAMRVISLSKMALQISSWYYDRNPTLKEATALDDTIIKTRDYYQTKHTELEKPIKRAPRY